ncbi:hypothetical protein V6C27_14495 [Peptococcaceae bacterium 1198_IL3148]
MPSKKFKFVEDKNELLWLCTFLTILVSSVIIVCHTSVNLEKKYQSALELINEQKWFQAEQILSLVSIYRYKDANILECYCIANIKLDLLDKDDLLRHNYAQVLDCINEIPDKYQGIYKDEIIIFKNNVLQKSNANKLIAKNPNTSTELQKSIPTVGDCLYYGRMYTTYPTFYGF